nr:zinc finger protein Rlf isoform X3 [Syngnathus scovelli]
MAERIVELEQEWNERALDTAEDTLVAMETLLATLRAFEDGLRQQELSVASSADYCDNFCQALMHYAGSRNSIDHGLPLLEVYCLSINCFAAARSHLTAESDKVTLVLKRLALSCFELFLSVPENEIPYEAWVQFHQSVQSAHDTLLQYGSTDLQALLQITGEGGAWSNPILAALLSGEPIIKQEVDAYICLEGEGFMEMRVKHLEKMGEVAKAVVLAKACTDCSAIPNQATFRHTYVALLCQLLPNAEAIMEISRQDCKDVLEITTNLEMEGEENAGFILCTTFLTQQLQQPSLDHSWELIQLWSKLQRKLDPSLVSLLERCLQLGAIAITVQHLLYLARLIQTEAEVVGTATSVELCVKALQLPKHDDSESRIGICKVLSGLLLNDLEVRRACHLTEFLLGPSQQVLSSLQELYQCPDQKHEQESSVIPNSLRCELLLVLKAHWSIDPEFWDWKALKYHCISLLGLKPESEWEADEEKSEKPPVLRVHTPTEESELKPCLNGSLHLHTQPDETPPRIIGGKAGGRRAKLCCRICTLFFTDIQIIHHAKRHIVDDIHPCPICPQNFRSRKELLPHMRHHLQRETLSNNVKIQDDEMEPGEITVDPSLILYYKSTRDPGVLQHIVQQAKTVQKKCTDNEHVTFEYMNQYFSLQNREEYFCPGTGCSRVFKHSKYLYVHLKSDHKGDENVQHFQQMREQREKCTFCRRHFVSPYHHHKHRKVHYCEQPYMCVAMGCGARFGSSNELVLHKQIHGYQIRYQCELEGCDVNYSDLGQLYHHEAQHFRDAAFTCPGVICKKFYFSKREFIAHLWTHNLKFSEEDFEDQRIAKETIFKADLERAAHVSSPNDAGESVVGDNQKSSSESRSASCCQPSGDVKPKALLTLVAVCFDGCKFTCGFEKCGMTFSRARDVQRHLKHAHPEHLKLEFKEHKHDKEQGPKSKKIKTEMESDNDEGELLDPCSPEEDGPEWTTSPASPTCAKNDVLNEILMRLSSLDLNSLKSPQSQPPQCIQNHHDVMEDRAEVLLSKPSSPPPKKNLTARAVQSLATTKPYVCAVVKCAFRTALVDNLSRHYNNVHGYPTEEAEQMAHFNATPPCPPQRNPTEEKVVQILANAKPYTCQIAKCHFRTARTYSLMRHYVKLHDRPQEEAKQMCVTDRSYKPFKCHLCSQTHREIKGLRNHYIQMHDVSASLVEKFSFRSTRPTSPTLQNLNPTVKIEAPSWEQEGKKNENRPNRTSCSSAPAVNEAQENQSEHKEDVEAEVTPQVRTKRLVTKSNLCYILDKFNKPFHCVAKNCAAAFSTQVGLVRHLQFTHHYKRSQLLLEKEVQQDPEVKKENVRKRPYPSSDEPKPQFQCQFVNCNASYHLKSSLARHTRIVHSQMPGLIRCKFEGCTKVFTHNEALKKHTLFRHCEYYDSLVVRLQSTQKKSVTGCQKKLIVTPTNPASPEPKQPAQSDEEDDVTEDAEKSTVEAQRSYVVRSHEEALQMCQDRFLPVTYPCMIQDCDSVLKYSRGLNRHYKKVHHMPKKYIQNNTDTLFYNAEQLEELIQKKSARPTIVGEENPNGVCKMKYQPETSQEQDAQVKLHSVTAETQMETLSDPLRLPVEEVPPPAEKNGPLSDPLRFPEEEVLPPAEGNGPLSDPLRFPEEEVPPPAEKNGPLSDPLRFPVEEVLPPAEKNGPLSDPLRFPVEEVLPPAERNGVLVGADDVLYGEPSTATHAEDSVVPNGHKKVEELLNLEQIKPLLRPFTINLSPPCCVLLTTEEGLQDAAKDGKISEKSSSPPVRQPLKRKNELSVQPSNVIDPPPLGSPPHSFDIATYKPVGFEASFLKFIQESAPKDKKTRRESFRRSCSVKENKQLGITYTRSRRSHATLHKCRGMTGDFPSVRNLKSILDKALAGCGDLAIKQLQYLRPVVVLGKPVCMASLPHLFPTDSNSKLLLGSKV